MPSNCIYSNLKTFLRELKRDTILTNIGTILFADRVRLLGMELTCTGALYPLL